MDDSLRFRGFIARGRDLGRLLSSLDEAYTSGHCAAQSITVRILSA
ncbi:hypothetical protein IU449_04585 [Nocardia higoensis]|uniref:Uncharacterized protein n=1 Tax=Nocardia higoensis TaxID=228599 RepID=A0ABS0DAU4_9NOCA|nr:hypothetical protein [Nocardia higoensis]MBF6353833.1 hypothetical protein [Nocardia higoensis]